MRTACGVSAEFSVTVVFHQGQHVPANVSGKKNSESYCMHMTWGYWQIQKPGHAQRSVEESQEEKKGLKVNANKTEVMVCTREVRVEA